MHEAVQLSAADYAMIATVVVCAVVGALRGLLREIIAVISWILAVFVAWHFAGRITPHLGGLMAGAEVAPWAARALLLAAVLLAGGALAAIICHFARLSVFTGMDHMLGLLLGLVRGMLIVGVGIIAGQALHLDQGSLWRDSTLIPYGEDAAAVLRALGGDQARHPLAVSNASVP